MINLHVLYVLAQCGTNHTAFIEPTLLLFNLQEVTPGEPQLLHVLRLFLWFLAGPGVTSELAGGGGLDEHASGKFLWNSWRGAQFKGALVHSSTLMDIKAVEEHEWTLVSVTKSPWSCIELPKTTIIWNESVRGAQTRSWRFLLKHKYSKPGDEQVPSVFEQHHQPELDTKPPAPEISPHSHLAEDPDGLNYSPALYNISSEK